MTESDISSKTLDQHLDLTSFTVTLVWVKHLDTAVSRKVSGKIIKMHEKTKKVM